MLSGDSKMPDCLPTRSRQRKYRSGSTFFSFDSWLPLPQGVSTSVFVFFVFVWPPQTAWRVDRSIDSNALMVVLLGQRREGGAIACVPRARAIASRRMLGVDRRHR